MATFTKIIWLYVLIMLCAARGARAQEQVQSAGYLCGVTFVAHDKVPVWRGDGPPPLGFVWLGRVQRWAIHVDECRVHWLALRDFRDPIARNESAWSCVWWFQYYDAYVRCDECVLLNSPSWYWHGDYLVITDLTMIAGVPVQRIALRPEPGEAVFVADGYLAVCRRW